MRNEKTVEQLKAEIRASIKRDNQKGLWDAFWSHIVFLSYE
jgi:hypothetical protein